MLGVLVPIFALSFPVLQEKSCVIRLTWPDFKLYTFLLEKAECMDAYDLVDGVQLQLACLKPAAGTIKLFFPWPVLATSTLLVTEEGPDTVITYDCCQEIWLIFWPSVRTRKH
jgi:hypothetical protein